MGDVRMLPERGSSLCPYGCGERRELRAGDADPWRGHKKACPAIRHEGVILALRRAADALATGKLDTVVAVLVREDSSACVLDLDPTAEYELERSPTPRWAVYTNAGSEGSVGALLELADARAVDVIGVVAEEVDGG